MLSPTPDIVSGTIRSLKALGKFLTDDGGLNQLRPLCAREVLVGPALSDNEMDGVAWLIWLYYNGIGGLLVDRRLMSHTAVVAAAFQSLFSQRVHGTHLVITSRVERWISDLEEGAPAVQIKLMSAGTLKQRRVMRHSLGAAHKAASTMQSKGSSPPDDIDGWAGYVMLVTPSVFQLEPSLQTFPWDFLILDEATTNFDLRLNRMKYVARVMLVQQTSPMNLIRAALGVTGRSVQTTPVLGPDVLDDFTAAMSPFTFSFVVHTPPLLYICVRCPSSILQKETYDRYMEKQSSAQVRQAQLRKVCSHPYLFDEHIPDQLREKRDGDKQLAERVVRTSGKLNTLHRLLLSVVAGSRVLVCSHMTRMLDLIETSLQLSNAYYNTSFSFARSDGSEGPSSPIHLQTSKHVSSLAGFDWVIVFDSDSNVAADLHLISLATPSTKFIRLIAPGSIDEAILAITSHALESANLTIRWGDCMPMAAIKPHANGDIVTAIDTILATLVLGVQSPDLPLLSVDELRQLLF